MIPRCLPAITILLVAGCGSAVKAEQEDSGAADSPADSVPEIVADTLPDSAPDPTHDGNADTAPGPGMTGDPCIEDAECTGVPGEGRFCLDVIDFGGGYTVTFPGGYCSAQCDDGSECGSGSDCIMFGSVGLCLERCTSAEQCRTAEGYVCYPIPYVTTDPYCVPYM